MAAAYTETFADVCFSSAPITQMKYIHIRSFTGHQKGSNISWVLSHLCSAKTYFTFTELKQKKKKIRSRRIPTAHVIYGIPLWLEDICIHLALHLWPNVSLITSHVDTQLFICDWINKIPWLGCGGTLRCVRSNSLLKVEGCRGEKIKKVRRRGEIETHKGQLGCCGRRRIWSRGDLGIHTGRDC